MKFQRTPLILLLIALGLGGFVYCSEFKSEPQPAATQAQAKPIFSFKEDEIQILNIQSPRNTLSFEKGAAASKEPKKSDDPKKDPKGKPSATSTWQMTAPEKVPASDGQVAFLLNLLATGKSDRTLTVPVSRLAEFGLDRPSATIEVKLSNQQSHKLLIGLPNFDRRFVYAQADPPVTANQEVTVLLVPFDFHNAVDQPLSDWKPAVEKKVPQANKPSASSDSPAEPSSEAAPLLSPVPSITPSTPPASPSPNP